MENKNIEKTSVRWAAPVLMIWCLWFLTYYLVPAYCGPQIVVSDAYKVGSGTMTNWAIGLIKGSQKIYSCCPGTVVNSSDTNPTCFTDTACEDANDVYWTVTGSPDGTEHIFASVGSTGTAGNWHAGSVDADNQFVLSVSNNEALTLSTTPLKIYHGLRASDQPFRVGLTLTTPTAGYQGAQNIAVTLTATDWQPNSPFLTYTGNTTHTEADCNAIGGTVYGVVLGLGDDAHAGTTFCAIPGYLIPTGWVSANGWCCSVDVYNQFPADACGRYGLNYGHANPTGWASRSFSGVYYTLTLTSYHSTCSSYTTRYHNSTSSASNIYTVSQHQCDLYSTTPSAECAYSVSHRGVY